MNQIITLALFLGPVAVLCDFAQASDAGRQEIWHGMAGARPIWPIDALDKLPEQVWGRSVVPGSDEYKSELMHRYGLFYDPSNSNDGLPVGLTKTDARIYNAWQWKEGMVVNCRLCHSSVVDGQVMDGISNPFIDFQALHEDLHAAAGTPKGSRFVHNIRGNSFAFYANYSGRLVAYIRNPFPVVNWERMIAIFVDEDEDNFHARRLAPELPLRALVRPQPWVNYKYKRSSARGIYVDGGGMTSPAGTHYALSFTMTSSGLDFLSAVRRFDQAAPHYLETLTAPRWPWPDELDREKILRGVRHYRQRCSTCHGSASRESATHYRIADYPGRLISREVLGTDPLRIDYRIEYDDEVPEVLRNQFIKTGKYIAPPLEGIWSRAPYLHNGSIPNLRQLLVPAARQTRFSMRPSFDLANYDRARVGWTLCSSGDVCARNYDPTGFQGMGNGGHEFTNDLSPAEVDDLLEFLKTL